MALDELLKSMQMFNDSLSGLGASLAINDARKKVNEVNNEFKSKLNSGPPSQKDQQAYFQQLNMLGSDLSAQLAAMGRPQTEIVGATDFAPSTGALFQAFSNEQANKTAQEARLAVAKESNKNKLSPTEKLYSKVSEIIAVDEVKSKQAQTKLAGQLPDYYTATGDLSKEALKAVKEGRQLGGDLMSRVSQLKTAVLEGGTTINPVSNQYSKLTELHKEAGIMIKELSKLGAITTPDVPYIEAPLINPTSTKAQFISKADIAKNYERMEMRLVERAARTLSTNKVQSEGMEKLPKLLPLMQKAIELDNDTDTLDINGNKFTKKEIFEMFDIIKNKMFAAVPGKG